MIEVVVSRPEINILEGTWGEQKSIVERTELNWRENWRENWTEESLQRLWSYEDSNFLLEEQQTICCTVFTKTLVANAEVREFASVDRNWVSPTTLDIQDSALRNQDISVAPLAALDATPPADSLLFLHAL